MSHARLLSAPLPIDRTAARVVSSGSDHWEPSQERIDAVRRTTGRKTWSAPPLPEIDVGRRLPGCDLRGLNQGEMTVVRLHANCADSRWLCQCSCGMYEWRKQSWLREPLRDGSVLRTCGVCEARRLALDPNAAPVGAGADAHAKQLARVWRLEQAGKKFSAKDKRKIKQTLLRAA